MSINHSPPSSSPLSDHSGSDNEQQPKSGKYGPAHEGLQLNEDYVHPRNIHSDSTVPHVSTTAPSKPGHYERTAIKATQEVWKNEEDPDPYSRPSSRSTTAASEASTTDSMVQNEGRKPKHETDRLLSAASTNKQYSHDENLENNRKDSPITSNTPPPKSKFVTGETQRRDLHYEGGARYSGVVSAPPQPHVAPPQQGVPGQQPPQLQRANHPMYIRVAKKVRMGGCLFSIVICLACIVVIVVWPTVISRQFSHTFHPYTNLHGPVEVMSQNRLTQGGITVTIPTNNSEIYNQLTVKAYYGPPPADKYYKNNTIYTTTIPDVSPVSGSDIVRRFSPLMFNLGRSGGRVYFEVTPNMTLKSMYVFVFAKYDALEKFLSNNRDCNSTDPDGCVCLLEGEILSNGRMGVTYNYTTEDNGCGVKANVFQHQRSFLIQIESDHLTGVGASLYVHANTSGVLDLDELPGMKNCLKSPLTGTGINFTCDHGYESFFAEISGNSRTFVTTSYSMCIDMEKHCFNPVLELQVVESARTDFIWFLVGVVLALILIIVIAYRYQDIQKIPGGLYNCTVRLCRHPVAGRVYQAIA